jgi:hypothetical protein
MFSSSLSLRQNIKEVDTELSNYKVSNDGRVDVLETFKAGLEGSGDGSIADLQAKHEEQALLIGTLETNAAALQARIDTFNAGLEDGADGTVSTIEQIQLNKVGLAQELVDRGTEITRVEGLVTSEAEARASADTTLGGRLDQEIIDRGLAVSAEATARVAGDANEASLRATAINNEVVNRNNAIAVETGNRQTAITAEQTARTEAVDKLGFISTAEAEGVLTVGSTPFCFGMGNQSEAGYGLPVPFDFFLWKIAYTSVSTDNSPEVTFKVTNYPYDGSTPMVVISSLPIVGKNKIHTHSPTVAGCVAGNLVVEVESVSGMVDDNAKFRMSFVLTSQESIKV